ncbi:MAG: metallopeptidase TldD-related protein [Bacteroidales bacterium]|nr:metallopeptidase TldD-related protein [Bacteroidales bacterium]
MQISKKIYTAIFAILCFGPVQGQIQNDPILTSIKTEVERNKTGLHAGMLESPFWISFCFQQAGNINISASRGDLISQSVKPDNEGVANILVGNARLNNNNFQSSLNFYGGGSIGKTNIESAIKYAIWKQLDPAYKKAAESLERKKMEINQQNIPEEEFKTNDWDQSLPTQYYQVQEDQKINMDFLSDYCRKASMALCQDPAILESGFTADITQGHYYYYSTDGFMFKLPMRCIKMSGIVECRTKDGQKMNERYCYYFDDISDLPPIENLCSEIIGYNKLLIEESNAPLITDSYSGPVLFEGIAVSDAIRTLFLNKDNGLLAKRKKISQSGKSNYYEGYGMPSREGNSENRMGQMINKKVADRRLDFISMTGTPRWNGQKLWGYTPIDAQGVKPDSSLTLIEDGILMNLLSDRTPTKTNSKSNGHHLFKTGSADSGLGVGVLRLQSSKTIPGKNLKDSLLAAAKDEGYDFAYIKRGYGHMSGCFLYKVYPDGREEMVRDFSINDLNQKQFKYLLQIGAEETINNTIIDNSKSTIIAPYGLIFKELEIVRNNNIKLNLPFIVPRPERKDKK